MKKLIIFFSLIISPALFYPAAAKDSPTVLQDGPYDFPRKNYAKAHTDSSLCANMMKRFSKATIADPILNGYKGAVMATMANHVTDKAEKLRLFKEGRSAMEQSIIKDTNSVELRFLRLTVQSNCPKVLNYNKEISSDKEYILRNFASLKNADIKKMIRDFAKNTDIFTPDEKKKLK